MIELSWKREYETGDPIVDGEHRQFLYLYNLLQQSLAKGHEAGMIVEAFDALRNYSKLHFSDEEQFWARINSPNVEAHKAEHDRMIDELEQLWSDYMMGENLPDALGNWMTHQLVPHFLVTDRAAMQAASTPNR